MSGGNGVNGASDTDGTSGANGTMAVGERNASAPADGTSGAAVERGPSLRETWTVRNSAAHTLLLVEQQLRRQIEDATVDELVALIESFSPGRSSGPDWGRSFALLAERLWAWRDDETMAALAREFEGRELPWQAVAHSLSPERGAALRARSRRPAYARFPQLTLA